MLILTCKRNQSITIGDEVRIVVMGVDRGQVKLGIEAPPTVSIRRAEVDDPSR